MNVAHNSVEFVWLKDTRANITIDATSDIVVMGQPTCTVRLNITAVLDSMQDAFASTVLHC